MEYTEQQQALLQKVTALQQEKQLSQNALGKLLGISGTALSQLRNGKYQADPQRMFDILESYFGVKEQTEQTYQEVPYADTSISEEIYDVISVCQIKGGLAVAAGDAGIGKTKAARHYVALHPENSILMTMNLCLINIKAVLNLLADKLNLSPGRSKDALWYAIVQKLKDGMVLIFDEAQHLNLKTIEVLRSFSDYFADRGQTLGICFIGNLDTVTKMGSQKAEFAQISNRTKQRKTYLRSQIQRSDIEKLFPILVQENKELELDFLLQTARTEPSTCFPTPTTTRTTAMPDWSPWQSSWNWRSKMKNGKKPTKSQKQLLQQFGFQAEDWLIVKNTSTELLIQHRYTGRTRHVPKQFQN